MKHPQGKKLIFLIATQTPPFYGGRGGWGWHTQFMSKFFQLRKYFCHMFEHGRSLRRRGGYSPLDNLHSNRWWYIRTANAACTKISGFINIPRGAVLKEVWAFFWGSIRGRIVLWTNVLFCDRLHGLQLKQFSLQGIAVLIEYCSVWLLLKRLFS